MSSVLHTTKRFICHPEISNWSQFEVIKTIDGGLEEITVIQVDQLFNGELKSTGVKFGWDSHLKAIAWANKEAQMMIDASNHKPTWD